MKHSDWEGQRERLSAFLDDEMASDEGAALATHLADCAECQRELAALRQTRALLRALPTATPPRAFTLPPTATSPRAPATPRRGTVSYPRWARPAQALGGVAAAIGLGLLVTTSLPAPPALTPHFGGAASSAGATTYAPTTSGQHSSANPAHEPTNSSQSQAAVAQTATAQATATATFGSQTAAPKAPVSHALAVSAPPAPLSGGLLLVGGAAAITAGGVARRRARRGGARSADEHAG